MSAASELELAYARCEAITRQEAGNFFYGIRLLSSERRRAMCAVYAFARRVDDIGDGTLADQREAGAAGLRGGDADGASNCLGARRRPGGAAH